MKSEILRVQGLTKVFGGETRVDHVSFGLQRGTVLGLVGESGSGKTTLARMIAGLETPTEGEILLDTDAVQMVFQFPKESFDPRRTLGDGIAEGMRNRGMKRRDARERSERLLVECGLSPDFFGRYPREVSGGECQRAAIARALGVRPELLILDEPTSALDTTVQKQILVLLRKLQEKFAMSFLFITHDIAVAKFMCDDILVMREGRFTGKNE